MALGSQKQLTEDEKQELEREARKMAAFLYDLYVEHKAKKAKPEQPVETSLLRAPRPSLAQHDSQQK